MATKKATVKTVQSVAEEFKNLFHQKKRKDGTEFWAYDSENHNHPIFEMTLHAHDDGKFPPDDTRYQYIVDALYILMDCEDGDDMDARRDEMEPDYYNAELTAWLSSSLHRIWYCDDAGEEYGFDKEGGIIRLIQCGQVKERQEVFDQVRGWIERYVKDQI